MTATTPPEPFAVATCLVCGEQVTALMAPLHIEDHKQRGERPTRPTQPARGSVTR